MGVLQHDAEQVYAWLDDMFSEGVRTRGELLVQQKVPVDLSVTVTAGDGYVDFTSASDGGTRRVRLTSNSNSGAAGGAPGTDWIGTFGTPHATLPRVDRVVATVQDQDLDASGQSRWKLDVVAGTPTSGATLANLSGAAAVPDNSLLLANVLLSAAATTITNDKIDATVAPVAAFGSGNALSSLTRKGLVLVGDAELNADGQIAFSSIPQSHQTLMLVGYVRCASALTESTAVLTFNGDTGANYDAQRVVGVGSSWSANPFSPANNVIDLSATVGLAQTELHLGVAPASSAPAGLYASVQVWIPDYASSSKNKAVISTVISKSGQLNASYDLTHLNGHWRSNAAITSLKVAETGAGLLDGGSRLTLYALAVG